MQLPWSIPFYDFPQHPCMRPWAQGPSWRGENLRH